MPFAQLNGDGDALGDAEGLSDGKALGNGVEGLRDGTTVLPAVARLSAVTIGDRSGACIQTSPGQKSTDTDGATPGRHAPGREDRESR